MPFPEIQCPPLGIKVGPLPAVDRLDTANFNTIDFAGYGTTPNTRMSYVMSPADPTRLAVFHDLRSGDVAGHWGGHRCEQWRHPHDLAEGDESWHAWSWWFDDGFVPPSAWMELGQIHSGDGGSPVQALECLPNGHLNLSIRGDSNTDLGIVPRKTPIKVLLHVKHSSVWSKGLVEFWMGWDPLKTPTIRRTAQTLYGGNSWTKIGIYSNSGACQATLLGLGRAATAARAIELASGSAMTPTTIARTVYASVPDGSLDLLWKPDGKHTAGQGYIGAENDPLGGQFRVQRHTVHDGDMLWGGERCETTTPKIGGSVGTRFQIGFKLLLPAGFQSDSSGWNSLWDMHYPNDGPAQSPMTVSVRNSNELWIRVLGGPLTQDGTMGTVRVEKKVATLTHNVWHTLAWDISQQYDATGIFDTWVDGIKVDTERTPTLSPGRPNTTYWKQGFYRSQTSSGTATYYFGDTIAVNGGIDELLPLLSVPTAIPTPTDPFAAAQVKIDAIKVANPKIAASDQALLDLIKART